MLFVSFTIFFLLGNFGRLGLDRVHVNLITHRRPRRGDSKTRMNPLVDEHHELRTVNSLQDTLSEFESDKSTLPILLIIEDLSPSVMKLLGSRYNIDAAFFQEQIAETSEADSCSAKYRLRITLATTAKFTRFWIQILRDLQVKKGSSRFKVRVMY